MSRYHSFLSLLLLTNLHKHYTARLFGIHTVIVTLPLKYVEHASIRKRVLVVGKFVDDFVIKYIWHGNDGT
jgi:hypothetical protein